MDQQERYRQIERNLRLAGVMLGIAALNLIVLIALLLGRLLGAW